MMGDVFDAFLALNGDWPPHYQHDVNEKRHPYPILLAMRALVFINGEITYYAMLDVGFGKFISDSFEKHRDPYKIISQEFLNFMTSDAWDTAWKTFEYYSKIISKPIRHAAVMSLEMNWDWNLRNLCGFLETSINPLDPKERDKLKRLKNLPNKPVLDQLESLEYISDQVFGFSDLVLRHRKELSLVRNIGAHHQWLVDEKYLKECNKPRWKVGDIRLVDMEELIEWQESVGTIVMTVSRKIAEKYWDAPDYGNS